MEKNENSKMYNMHSFIINDLNEAMQNYRQLSFVKTGFENIDNISPLSPGLILLGATPGLGKTTLILQMCDHMAKSGEHILFFSFEQNGLDFASKSLSRIMFQQNRSTALSAAKIRLLSSDDERIQEAKNEYLTYADNISFVECTFKMTMSEIESCINDYIETTGVKPVVFIDYLQVIHPEPGFSSGAKSDVDNHIKHLEDLKKKLNLIIIVISSLNRQNYTSSISLESFKESGDIEYSADIIWGLQLKVINNDKAFNSNGNPNRKRKAVYTAMAKPVRELELICLKNRGNLGYYRCCLNYYPKYDFFEPAPDKTQKLNYETDNDLFDEELDFDEEL